MSGKLAAVINQALKTFATVREPPRNLLDCPQFQVLTTLVDNLRFVDIHREHNLAVNCESAMDSPNPVEYVPLYRDTKVTIGLFIVKLGETIPLHDHPGMHGIIKVLNGELRVTSYDLPIITQDKVDEQFYYSAPIQVNKNPIATVSVSDRSCVLTPTLRNIHEVTCTKGPGGAALFLDILAPPYCENSQMNAPRSCHYFEEIVEKNIVKLKQIPNPPGF